LWPKGGASIETLELAGGELRAHGEAPDLLPDDRLAGPEPAVAAKLLLDAVSQERAPVSA